MNVSSCNVLRERVSSLLPTSSFRLNKASDGLSCVCCCEMARIRNVRVILTVLLSTIFTLHLMYGNLPS